MTFGEKLQLLRKQNGLSQEQLASQLTVSGQAISKWELDTSLPDTENIIQISNIFDVSIDYLLKEDAEQGNESTPPNQNHTTIASKSLTSKIMMLVGGVGILVFWILSSVFPAVTSCAEAGSDTAIVKHGLPAFLEIHNMKLLFILCCITFIAGLIMFFILLSNLKSNGQNEHTPYRFYRWSSTKSEGVPLYAPRIMPANE